MFGLVLMKNTGQGGNSSRIRNIHFLQEVFLSKKCTVKFGNKERFEKEQIGVKEPLPMTNCQFTL